MKILLLDIETAPNIAYVWRLFKENVPLARLIETSYVMCWAAKWLDQDMVFFNSVHHSQPDVMLYNIRDLLDEAEVVIHFNGKAFDIPTLDKDRAYKLVQELAFTCQAEGSSLPEQCEANPEISSLLDRRARNRALDLKRLLGNVDAVYRRVGLAGGKSKVQSRKSKV